MHKTRSKGEGSISLRSDGKWLGQVTLGRDGNGKRIRRSVVAATKREVLERLQELREAKRKDALTASSRLTVAEYLDQWLEQKKTEVARRTHASYANLVRLHIQTTALAGVRLQAVTGLHIQGWLGELERRGLSPRRRADARQVLRTAVEAAVDLGVVAQNPVARVKAPKVVVGDRRWLTPDEVKRLLQVAEQEPPAVRAFVLLLVATGIRYGEIAGLTWAGVDLDAGTITISQALKK